MRTFRDSGLALTWSFFITTLSFGVGMKLTIQPEIEKTNKTQKVAAMAITKSMLRCKI